MRPPDLAAMELADALAVLRADKPPQSPPAAALVEDRVISGGGGNIPIRIYRPAATGKFGALLHFHGGGWVGGGISNDDLRCHAMSMRAHVIVVSVKYRLAPEHRFPAGLQDCHAALRWVHENADALGVVPHRIGLSGSSAGGNLAAVVTLLARAQGDPAIACLVLAYPVCDTSLDWPSYRENEAAPLLGARMMAWFIEQYLPPDADRADPMVAPLNAVDLSGFPPALVITAQCDPLRDEGMAFAARLSKAGVDTVAACHAGMVHGFMTRFADHPESQAAMDRVIVFLRRYLND